MCNVKGSQASSSWVNYRTRKSGKKRANKNVRTKQGALSAACLPAR